MSKFFIAAYKIIAGLVVLTAVAFQFKFGLDSVGNFQASNFFSFFTIESNILAAVTFLVSALFILANKKSQGLDVLRGATTLYMVITGIVYVLLLSGLEESLQTPIPWVNFTLHYAFPIIALLDWLIDRTAYGIRLKQAMLWLIFPVGYAIYSLVRGAITGWYPYPFLNPVTEGGYVKVIIVSCLIAVAAYGLSAALSSVPARKR